MIYHILASRRDRNRVNNGTTGLLMSPQLGDIEKELGVSSPKLSGDRPGFAVQNDTSLEERSKVRGFQLLVHEQRKNVRGFHCR